MTKTPTILKRVLVLAVATVALSSLSFATILCGGAPQTILAISTAGGCTYGTNIFTNVSIATSTEFPGTPVDAIAPGTVELTMTGALTNPGVVNVVLSNSDAGSWSLTGSQEFNIILTYTVTGSAAYFSAFADSFNGSGTGNGAISYDKAANNQALPMTLGLSMTSQAPLAFTGGPIQTFNVLDNIVVHASNGTATLANATNSFTMVPTVISTAPEPMTSIMLGSGLLAFGFMLRRKRS
jgi:hypothetical protein